jgi:hypothetical protein
LPLNCGETGSGEDRSKKDKAGLGTCGLSLGEYSDERNEGAQDHNRLQTGCSRDPFQDIGLELDKPRFEPLREVRQIRLCSKIALRRFPQGFGKSLRLLGGKLAFLSQGPGEAQGIERNGVHRRNMERGGREVHWRGGCHGLKTHTGLHLFRRCKANVVRPQVVRIQIFGAAQRTISRITWPRAASNAAATAKGSLEGDATLAENSRPAMMRPLV